MSRRPRHPTGRKQRPLLSASVEARDADDQGRACSLALVALRDAVPGPVSYSWLEELRVSAGPSFFDGIQPLSALRILARFALNGGSVRAALAKQARRAAPIEMMLLPRPAASPTFTWKRTVPLQVLLGQRD